MQPASQVPFNGNVVRVLLVDEHELLRWGVRHLLHQAGGIDVVAETAQGEEALMLARYLRPDIVILDIGLRGLNGVEVARALRQDLPATEIIVYTGHDAERASHTLSALNVHRYVAKDGPTAVLLRVVYTVRDEIRQRAAPATVGSMHLKGQGGDTRDDRSVNGVLSRREGQVLNLLGRGMRSKEIARTLEIKPHTVNDHIKRVKAKLHANSRAEAVTIAVRRGLIEL